MYEKCEMFTTPKIPDFTALCFFYYKVVNLCMLGTCNVQLTFLLKSCDLIVYMKLLCFIAYSDLIYFLFFLKIN